MGVSNRWPSSISELISRMEMRLRAPVTRGYFFLLGASRLVNAASPRSIDQKKISSGTQGSISKAPLGRSLWSGHHWKDLLLLQKLSIDDANFGQKRWRQKRKKGQASSRAVTGGTGVNGLIRFDMTFDVMLRDGSSLSKLTNSCY